ncbi:alpha/beta hydrolase [Pontibacter sp. G13]|uniref:alpha/beta fold hydrolase n=1 Tax=Pontibacter sp. G13 TaxID=3074898 RepID=UPI00288BF719|nr:alpha/beta hydrolase [Pontibacter sp. G13]WNJ20945.1 alpha/beta hydrolase [Pontibacter sp. G13]
MTLFLSTIAALSCAILVLLAIYQLAMYVNLYMIKTNEAQGAFGGLPESLAGVDVQIHTPDGAILNLWHRGSGPAVILLHDLGMNAAAWHPVWSRLANYGYRVIALDLRGHGSSSLGNGQVNLAQLQTDFHLAMDHMNVQNAWVLGHGLGASIALDFLQNQPMSARRFIAGVVCVGGHSQGESMGNLKYAWVRNSIGTTRFQRLLRLPSYGWGFASSAFGSDVSPKMIQSFLGLLQKGPMTAYRTVLGELAKAQSRFGRIGVPVLILASLNDRKFSLKSAHDLVKALPMGALQIMPDYVGNMMIWECPNQLVEGFRAFSRGSDESLAS